MFFGTDAAAGNDFSNIAESSVFAQNRRGRGGRGIFFQYRRTMYQPTVLPTVYPIEKTAGRMAGIGVDSGKKVKIVASHPAPTQLLHL